MPFFSIIIPVYNIENYIRNCLDSVANQSFRDYEVLLIDDGTKDNSGIICDEYAKCYPEHFFVYHFENGGVSAARNRGLERARGEFVVFVDGDDILDKCYLQTFYDMICEYKTIDLAICGILINGKNVVYGGKQCCNGSLSENTLLDSIVSRNGVRGYLFNKAFRRSVLVQHNIWFEKTAHMCEDLLLCAEFLRHTKDAALVNLPNYEYVQRDNSAVHQKFNKKRISVLTTYKTIMDIFSEFGAPQANLQLKGNFLMHNVHVLWMLRGRKDYANERAETRQYIRNNIGVILRTNVGARQVCKAIVVYLLSFAL